MYKDFKKYEIYDDGRIWSYSRKKFLKPWTTKNGYQQVILVDNEGKMKKYLVHRIVYQAISGEEIPEGFEVNHINECKTDNRFDNLNLLTHKDNINWGTGIERCSKKRSKQVGAFNKNGELVFVFSSSKEAESMGFNHSNISECCNGKRKTHKGYEWRYL